MTPSLLLDALPHPGQHITLNREQAHYLTRVLRLVKGDSLFLFDGRGTRCRGVLAEAHPKKTVLHCLETIPTIPESPVQITLLQGVPKGEKMDLVIQKATELGVHRIVPVVTERTQAQKSDRAARWRRIAESAAAQCGRSVVPDVSGPRTLRDALDGPPRTGVVFWERAAAPLEIAGKSRDSGAVTILVGPEGGLTAEEVAFAEGAGLRVAGLGPRVLRTETAAIAAITLVQYLLGDMGN